MRIRKVICINLQHSLFFQFNDMATVVAFKNTGIKQFLKPCAGYFFWKTIRAAYNYQPQFYFHV